MLNMAVVFEAFDGLKRASSDVAFIELAFGSKSSLRVISASSLKKGGREKRVRESVKTVEAPASTQEAAADLSEDRACREAIDKVLRKYQLQNMVSVRVAIKMRPREVDSTAAKISFCARVS